MLNAKQVSVFIAWHFGSSIPEVPAKYSVCLRSPFLRSHLKYTSISMEATVLKSAFSLSRSSLALSSDFLSYLPPAPSFLLPSGPYSVGAGSSTTERPVP